MRLFFTAALFFYANGIFSQNCTCGSQLSFVINYIEENNPAFQKVKAGAASYNTYLKEVQKIRLQAAAEKDDDLCIIYMDRYVRLIKDNHSGIGFNLKRIDLSTPELIAAFKRTDTYLGYSKINIDTAALITELGTKKQEDVEGIYSDGRTVVFGITKKINAPGKYLGIVLKQNKLLDAGHVLLELERRPDNSYDIIYNIGLLGFNFKKIFKNQFIKNGQIPSLGFAKKTNTITTGSEYEFKILDNTTSYLRLSAFDARLVKELDSLYSIIEKEIKSRPNLIIDVRGNSGGSERSFLNLLQYAYTKPLQLDSVNVWVSPENIKRYGEHEANKELVQRMKAATAFSFIPFSEDTAHTWSLDSITFYPKKIALLYDRGTASAAEGMIIYFMQSDKVITLGENSGGFIGYGNVITAQTPCEKFTINSTTTRYFKKSKYEFVGIPPMYPVLKNKDWIQVARKLLDTPKN